MRRNTPEQWLSLFAAAHGAAYDYRHATFQTGKIPVTIVCREHGSFLQSPQKHAAGQGCPVCRYTKAGNTQRHTLTEFLAVARSVHGSRYSYEKVVYTGDRGPVRITCPTHGEFVQVAGDHKSGRGCPLCANLRRRVGRQKDLVHFIAKARSVHGDAYSYARAVYDHALAPITITCPVHGDFEQAANNHLTGYGCNRCARGGPSQVETDLLAFVQSVAPDAHGSDRKLIAPKELDIVVPSARVAIELNGVYWHSDQRAARSAHRQKFTAAASVGYRLLQITDHEWLTRRRQFESLIRRALGVCTGPVTNARQCAVVDLSHAETVEFLDANHPQPPGRVYSVRLGLRHPQHGLVAVMAFNKDAYSRNRTARGVWDLTRFASRGRVRGGASRLFKRAVQMHDMRHVVSYSANDWFAGGVYSQLGFERVACVPPDYRVFHPAHGFWTKTAWARKNIPARLQQLGHDPATFDPSSDSRTEWQMQDSVRALRLWDSGKVRWEWKQETPA